MGNTSLDEIRQFYATFDAYISQRKYQDGVSVLEAKFVDPQIEGGLQIRHMFRAQNNIFTEAEIQLNVQHNYQVEQFLKQMGQPSEIWMWTIPERLEGFLPADFLLYFPEHGVLVGYQTDAVREGSIIDVCFDKQGAGTLLLWNLNTWDPNGDKGFIERANESSELTLEGHRPLEEVSNWDVEQFYNILTDPNRTECLETPSSLWPSPW